MTELETLEKIIINSMTVNNEPRFPVELHELPLSVPRNIWKVDVAKAIKIAENQPLVSVPGNKWFSLRLDGNGFSKLMKKLRRKGIFPQGYSHDFGQMMVKSMTVLMDKMGAYCGYTQSDEMTLLFEPAKIINGIQNDHQRKGRIMKYCSLAASIVTSKFNKLLYDHCKKLNIDLDDNLLPNFDCRLGMFSSKTEAMMLILWRSHDCSINGVSDAVHHNIKTIDCDKSVIKKGTLCKLAWLRDNGMLPLNPHQSLGTFMIKKMFEFEAINQRTNEKVLVRRNRYVRVDGNVVNLYVDGNLFPGEIIEK
jgi:tRNA(His) 5'-end guanylyltransferase